MAPGTTVSHYRIESLLGGGGMGEVYRAHDTQLDRTVAVKVIRPEVAADPDRMRRFEKEARAVAALTHPSVAQVYEIGRADGLRFIVMEYVEGKTLHEFLRARLLTCREIVNLMVPVTEVLAEAHSKGIVHRDIKPGNIMVTERGTPKVLDFGLAKFDRGDPAAPTLTDPGQVMGTAEYMSPEQALGREVDSRTDIFSLGAVLYEMATGRPAFRGPTVAAVYDAILHRAPPPPREVNPEVPEALEHIIWKALEKDREMRYQTASDLRVDLKRIFHESATHPAAPVAPARRLRRWAWAAVTGAVLLAVLGAGLWFRGMRVAPRAPGANWRVLPLTSYPGNESHATFSPDGNQIAFTWNGAGVEKWDIYVKLVGAGTPLRLTTDPANDVSPAWSPDGRHIAFLREMDQSAALMIVPALGGLERKLADLWPHRVGHEAPFLAWSPDSGTLAVADRMSPNEPLSLYLVKVSSGERRRITTPPVNWLGDSCPAFSPDGKSLAFVRTSSVSVQDLYVLPLGGGQPKRLTEDNRRIFGMAWNPARNRILFSSNRGANSRLWEVAPNGGPPERLPGIGESAGFLAVTKDGARLAYSRSSIDTNIWRYFLPQGNTRKPPVRLISSTRHDLSPQYSPDGRRIVFSSNRSGSMEIWLCDSEGLNASQLTNFGGPPTGSPRWSPDGRWIAFDSRPGGNPDIYVVAAEGGTPRRLTTDPAEDVMPNWSQDGRYLYFASRRSGDYQVWKMPAEGGNAVPVTRLGGFFAQEAADGRYIYYVKGLNSPGLWRAPATGGEETPVLESLRAGYSAYWALSRQGVYYLERDDPADGPRRFYLHFLDLAARKDQRVMELDNRPFNAGLSLAPQGGSFLYSQVDSSDTDLLLVDDFQQR